MADTANGTSTMDSLKASKVRYISYQLLRDALSQGPTQFCSHQLPSSVPVVSTAMLTSLQCFRDSSHHFGHYDNADKLTNACSQMPRAPTTLLLPVCSILSSHFFV